MQNESSENLINIMNLNDYKIFGAFSYNGKCAQNNLDNFGFWGH